MCVRACVRVCVCVCSWVKDCMCEFSGITEGGGEGANGAPFLGGRIQKGKIYILKIEVIFCAQKYLYYWSNKRNDSKCLCLF